jgi:hypothetical protein
MSTENQNTNTSLPDLLKPFTISEGQKGLLTKEFSELLQKAELAAKSAFSVKVATAADTEQIERAKLGFEYVSELLKGVDATHKELKRDYLEGGRAVDAVKNSLKGILEPAKEYLRSQKDFIKLQKAAEEAALYEARLSLIDPYIAFTPINQMWGKMKQDEFDLILSNAKTAKENFELAEKLRIENEAIEAEKKRLDQIQKDLELRELRAKQAEADRLLQAEREATAKAEKEIFAQREAVLKAEREREAEKLRAEQAEREAQKAKDEAAKAEKKASEFIAAIQVPVANDAIKNDRFAPTAPAPLQAIKAKSIVEVTNEIKSIFEGALNVRSANLDNLKQFKTNVLGWCEWALQNCK